MACKWPISLARRSVRSSSAGTTIAHPTRNFDAMLSYSRSPTNAVQLISGPRAIRQLRRLRPASRDSEVSVQTHFGKLHRIPGETAIKARSPSESGMMRETTG